MALAPEIRNSIMAQLGPAYAHAYPKTIERDYPHVLEKITKLWGSLDMEKFFEELMLTQRSGRQGFPPDAFGELLALMNIYRKLGLIKAPPKKEGDVWSWISEVGYETSREQES
ncbi:MAG: hypothetical protein KJ634_05825 [Gammaproteobacteria bacterium]|nr:hypothetical protein [Gammaproteobacteria bacterium]MBU1415122.1 hypothetical protein [Gammaproteobacteria bacterium]